MEDQIVHLKTIEGTLQNLNRTLKNIEHNITRLASVENLLERVAIASETAMKSNERIEQAMMQSWQAYNELNKQQ